MSINFSEAKALVNRKILLYGDVNLNVMDGSAVWLVSMAEVLARTNSVVDVLLKTPVDDDRLIRKFSGDNRVRFISPVAQGTGFESISPRVAAQRILGLDSENGYDVIIARGLQVCQFIAGSEKLAKKAWLYVTDLPFPSSAVTESKKEALTKIALGSKRMFAQTEDARSYLESVVPQAAGKTVLLPPMVPDEFYVDEADAAPRVGEVLKLVYAGKFAKKWRTLEMCGLESRLQERDITAQVTFIGDKFQDDVQDPTWPQRMEEAISGPGVTWLGGLTREDTMKKVSQSHIGLGWRDSGMNSSLELSTKALEYAAAGVCPLLNRTAAHERLFGIDYPFFIDDDNVGDVVDVIAAGLGRFEDARRSLKKAAEFYSMGQAAQRLERAFERASTSASPLISHHRDRPLRVVLAGHDFKFAGELVDLLEADKNIELRIDRWATLHKHDESASLKLSEWADVVICEWAGPNAVWYSNNKRDGQALIVRLHAFELRGAWLSNIQPAALDAVVCVSTLYRDHTQAKTGWPREKLFVIPNAIDASDLLRPKSVGHEFRIGLVGMVPFLKRPDRALDLLEILLERDDRFTLHIKGRMPWEYSYEWMKPLQQQAYMEFFGRVGETKRLRQSVVFEPFGADIANWLSKIGYILSPSTQESFHLAPAEGMASGAVPIFWDRPGVSEIFGNGFKVDNAAQAASKILALTERRSEYLHASTSAKLKATDFDLITVKDQWARVMNYAASNLRAVNTDVGAQI